MSGLIGKKIGMTSVYTAEGKNTPCTILEIGPCYVSQVKTVETDGYEAVQIGYGDKKEKNTTKALKGHFKKAGVPTLSRLKEFTTFEEDLKLGQSLNVGDVFEEGQIVSVVGTSKGRGFQGVVKRYNFGGVGGQTHGQHNRLRAPGSIGACSTPSRVFKGMRMGGRMGSDRVTIENLQILKIFKDKNIILVSGSVPGSINSFVVVEK